MINKAILLGNVGKDPDIRTMTSGARVASFPLATSETWKDKEGNRKDKTEWHNVVVFSDKIISVIEKYIKKGTKLYIEGTIRTRKYTDSSSVEKYITEIVIQYDGIIRILDSKNSSSGDSSYSSSENSMESSSDSVDDDIPF